MYYNKQYSVPVGVIGRTDSNGTIFNTNTKGNLIVGSSVKSGNSVANYVARLQSGIDAGSNYIREDYSIRPFIARLQSSQHWGGQNVDDFQIRRDAYPLPDVSLIDMTLVIAEASNRLKRKLRETTGQSNQLTNVAELREVPKTIGAVASSAGKLVKTVLNSKRHGTDLRKFASDQWLTWSFGVLPTLGAVDDAIESVKSYLDRKDHKLTQYGVHSMDQLISTSVISSGSHHVNLKHSGSFKVNKSCKITAGYRYGLRSSNDYHLGKHLGFDISSVVPTAWELLPYSWLIDYFTTAGSYIEDAFAADFGQSIYISQNTLLRITGEVTLQPELIISLSKIDDFHQIPCKYEYYKFTRTMLSSLPRAPLRLKTTDEIAHNAVNKLLNLVSIIGRRN